MTQTPTPQPKSGKDLSSPHHSGGGFKAKATAFAVALGMLPVLAVGTTTYHFGSQSLNEQTAQARQIDDTGVLETKLGRQKQLLAILSIGTGAIALLSGAIAALWVRRTIGSTMTTAATATEPEDPEPRPERTQLLTEAINRIRASLKEEDILKTTVEEVRRAIKTDRVVVYSREEGSRGLVVAESVASGWPRALGRTIEDPCFEVRYDEAYRNGRVRAIDNIHKAGMTQCYIEQLEKLAVKANLVAPILNEGKLLGLLVAHQCSEYRAWQQSEIDLFAQIAAQVGFALDNARLLAEHARLQKQANIESQWTEFFTDAVGHLRSSLKEEDVLEAAVEEVRRVLACDRVVVYSREEGSRGLVVAESIAPGWSRALGKTIEDPCFQSRYDEAYQNGRVRAIDDIHEAGMTQCYIEQLEKLSVKANLVAPILNEGKLLGLLVAHQCSGSRAWKQFEIRWFAQIAAQVGFAIDNSRVLANSASFQEQADTESQWTQFFTDAIGHIRFSLKEEDVLKAAVEEVRRVLDSDRVVLYSREEESRGLVTAESVAPRWPKALGRTISDPCFEVRYDEKYRNGRVRAIDNIYEAGMTQCYIEQLEKLAVKANLVAPILNEGKLLGLLVAHQCSEPRAWQQFEIRWVAQMAAQVGFALDNARLIARLEATGMQTQLIRDFTFLLWDSLKEEDILQTAVEEARKAIKTDRVVVYSFDANWNGTVVAESVVPGWPRALWANIKDPCFEGDYAQKYQEGRVQAINNIYEAGLTECHLKQLEPFAVQANLVAPILKDNQLFGLLIAHQCDRPRNWQQTEIDLFSQLALQVGFALDCARRIEQIEQAYQITDSAPVQQQLRQKEALWRQISELLRDSETAFETFSRETSLQSEAITTALNQIQGAGDYARGMTATAEQVELQVQQTTQAAQTGSETAKRSVDSLCAIEEAVGDAAVKVKHLDQSCQKISEAVSSINDLAAQMNHQAINMTIGAGQTGDVTQESLVAIAETVRSLTQQLVEATEKIEPLVGEIETETNQVAAGMETQTKQAIAETQLLLEEQGQKLNQIATVSPQIKALVEELAQAAAEGVQSASQSIEKVASLAIETSEQSTAVAESFKKLKTVAQELEADGDEFKQR